MAKSYNLTKNEILSVLGPQWKYMGGSSRLYRNTETGRTISRRAALNMAADKLHGKSYYELTHPQRKQYQHLIDFYFQSAKEKPDHAEMDETIKDFKDTDIYRHRDTIPEQQILDAILHSIRYMTIQQSDIVDYHLEATNTMHTKGSYVLGSEGWAFFGPSKSLHNNRLILIVILFASYEMQDATNLYQLVNDLATYDVSKKMGERYLPQLREALESQMGGL